MAKEITEGYVILEGTNHVGVVLLDLKQKKKSFIKIQMGKEWTEQLSRDSLEFTCRGIVANEQELIRSTLHTLIARHRKWWNGGRYQVRKAVECLLGDQKNKKDEMAYKFKLGHLTPCVGDILVWRDYKCFFVGAEFAKAQAMVPELDKKELKVTRKANRELQAENNTLRKRNTDLLAVLQRACEALASNETNVALRLVISTLRSLLDQ